MSYPLLRKPDILPAAGVLQKLLNRGGAGLGVDGNFGPRTKAAVMDFQRPRGLAVDGAVGVNTWPRVSAGARSLLVIDCVDVFDASLYELEARDIRRAGGDPLLIGGMCNGVEQMVSNIVGSAPAGSVFLLRFHGHGAPGVAGISDGHGDIPGEHRSSIHPGNLALMRPIIRRLRPIFGPYGCIQFMHCETGSGPAGRTTLTAISDETGVPASAGLRTQFGGGLRTFRFEGPTQTAVSGGGNLQTWAAGLPDFAPMSVR